MESSWGHSVRRAPPPCTLLSCQGLRTTTVPSGTCALPMQALVSIDVNLRWETAGLRIGRSYSSLGVLSRLPGGPQCSHVVRALSALFP